MRFNEWFCLRSVTTYEPLFRLSAVVTLGEDWEGLWGIVALLGSGWFSFQERGNRQVIRPT